MPEKVKRRSPLHTTNSRAVSRRSLLALAAAPPQTAPQWEVRRRVNDAIFTAFCLTADDQPAATGTLDSQPRLWIGNTPPLALPEPASAIAATPDALWITTPTGIFSSPDLGKSWQRRWQGEGLQHIAFASPTRGFAAGTGKTLLETSDAGLRWARVPAADEPSTNTSATTYGWIHFVTPRVGIVTGWSRPNRQGPTSDLPFWRDPERATRRKEWPTTSITLETRDSGLQWKPNVTSAFGRITRVRYARDGQGVILIEFHDQFDWPAELYSINLKSGRMERVFRLANRAVTDVWLDPGGAATIAAIEPPAPPQTTGRIIFATAQAFANWQETPAPPSIAAGRVWLAANPNSPLWAATDTGVFFRSTHAR